MNTTHTFLAAAIIAILSCAACSSPPQGCKQVADALIAGGQKLMTDGKGKTDNDPSLAGMVEGYAATLKATDVKDAKVKAPRDAFIAALMRQGVATRAWQAAPTPAAKDAAAKDIAAARADQDKAGKDLATVCR